MRDAAGAAWVLGHPPLGTPVAGRRGDRSLRSSARVSTSRGKASGRATTSPPPTTERRPIGPSTTMVWRKPWCSDLISPPAGAPLLSAVGDIAGFRHDDLDVSPPGGMFGDPSFHNTTSLDFAELAPAIVARVGTSSSSGGNQVPTPPTGARRGPRLPPRPREAARHRLRCPPTARHSCGLPRGPNKPSYCARPAAPRGPQCAGISAGAQVAADRVNPSKFYASDRNGMYVSTDGGANFVKSHRVPVRAAAPRVRNRGGCLGCDEFRPVSFAGLGSDVRASPAGERRDGRWASGCRRRGRVIRPYTSPAR